MSQQTAALMGRSHRRQPKWPSVLSKVTDLLSAEYGTPSLGNFRDPIKEIFYILLSARTTETLYKRAHQELFRRFPKVELLAEATIDEITSCVDVAGLGRKRSLQILELAQQLVSDYGRSPGRKLRTLSMTEVYDYLTQLPGLGPKSALCVMMYSLDMDVFPVDVNVQRIAERMGVIPRGLKHYQAQQRLPKYVPVGRSKQLHIGMVVHGRRVCLPQKPTCNRCVIAALCKTGKNILNGDRLK